MSGSSLAPIIIPIAGTIFLAAWLILVLYADRSTRPSGNPAPSRTRPDPAAVTGPRQPDGCLMDTADLAGTGPFRDAHTRALPGPAVSPRLRRAARSRRNAGS